MGMMNMKSMGHVKSNCPNFNARAIHCEHFQEHQMTVKVKAVTYSNPQNRSQTKGTHP
jgi:hypothetical protein